MEDEAPEGTEEQQQGGGGLNVEVLRSYLAFAKQAIAKSKLLIALVALAGMALTIAVAKYLPRTYQSTTVMVASYNGVLDSDRGPQPLAGAENQILSQQNLEAVIKETNLKKKYYERRKGLLALKDKLVQAVVGPMSDKLMMQVLVGTLQNRIKVTIEKEALAINADWTDAQTSAELANAARDGFLRLRNAAEVSAFQEKMSILDAHAATLRDEIEQLAKQLKEDLAAKRAERAAEAAKSGVDPKRLVAGAAAPRVSVRPSKPVTDEQIPALRERLATLKQNLMQAESARSARIRDEQAKLDELKLRFTPNHPQVITQEERLGIASQVSSELSLARSEVADLESQIRQRESMAKTGKTAGGGVTASDVGAAPGADTLPIEIFSLLDQKELDPALSAQMSGAIIRYGSLRDDVRGAKLALDTAQAAFNHRYQIVSPVEVPTKPIKPKLPVVIGAGFVLSLLLAFALPVLLEVRRDLVVERWQVHHFRLPVLAELRLPASTKEQA